MTGPNATAMRPADTVVVCRPEQMQAAATVLSCFAADLLPPLFVVEHPPCSEARYRELYARYRRMCDRRDEDLGTLAARSAWLGKARAPGWTPTWTNEEIDRRVKALTPFRRWTKRHRLLGDVFRTLPLRRALVLFDPVPDDLSTLDPRVGKAVDACRTAMLADDVTVIRLPVEGDEPLWQRAWRVLRPGEAIPAAALDVTGHPAALIAGLHRARRLGLPLRVTDGAAPRGCVVEAAAAGSAVAEAVVVEAGDRADLLTAVFYALRQNAVFCVRPPVPVGAIERARRCVADWHGAEHAPEDHPPMAALEAAVARAVPRAVIDAVGSLPLTAWTAGVPYHLLKTDEADWSDKPIGLMTDDPLLLTSVELFDQGHHGRAFLPPDGLGVVRRDDRAAARLHVVFDPGDFGTDETDAVVRALDADPGCVLLAQGAAATQAALIAAGGAPLELLYFNTHGERDAISLDDMSMPGYKLLQRVTLASHPIVFNNSCQSWTGVGRDIVIAGARGCVGTLWPVLAAPAARLAEAAMRRIVAGGEPFAASLRGNRVDATIEQAYVFVGPVTARLRPPDTAFGDERARLSANAALLCEMGTFLCRQGPAPESPLVAPVLAALVARSDALVADIDARWPQPDLALLTRRLEFAMQFDFRTEHNVRRCVDMATRGLRIAGDANDTAAGDLDTKSSFWLACARVSRKLERWDDVVKLLGFSIDTQAAAGRAAGEELLDRCDALRRLGKLDLAIADAQRAQAAFTDLAVRPGGAPHGRRGAMLASGRLADLYRRSGQFDAALVAMRDGHQAAVALGDLSEQAAFKSDESAILRDRGDRAGAIAAAELALACVRRAHDDAQELGVLGMLTLALRADRQWDLARRAAEDGLAAARRLRQAGSAVSFLCDLAAIAKEVDDAAGACARLTEGAAIAAASGAAAQARRVLIDADALLDSLPTWLVRRMALRVTVMVIGTLPPQQRSTACTQAMSRLLSGIAASGWVAARDPLWRASSELARVRDAQGEQFPEQGRFLLDAVAACYLRAKGTVDTAQSMAAPLDALSAGGFGLTAFMGGGGSTGVDPPQVEHPAWRAARDARR